MQGAQRRDGQASQRMGWLSGKADGTRGREGGIPDVGTQVCVSTLS